MANNISGMPPALRASQQVDPSTAATATTTGPTLSTRPPSPPTRLQDPNRLHQAAAKGDYPRLLDALKSEIYRVNELSPDTGRTPLQAAQIGGHQDAAQLLINAGARVYPLEPGYTPSTVSLHSAAEEGNPELLAAVLKGSKADLNKPDSLYGLTPLMFAVRGKHREAVGMLLEAGAKPNRMDARNKLPAVEAAGHGSTTVLALLLEGGASAQRPDGIGNTPLMAASLFGSLDTMTLVLEKKVPVDQPDSSGATALFKAVMSGRADKVRLLLENGADAGHVDRSGRTPLMLASQLPHTQVIVPLLEQHGRSMNGTGE